MRPPALVALFVVFTAATATALSTGAVIVSVSPTVVRSTGGEIVTLTGFNFRAPARVLLDVGGTTKEGVVVSMTNTQLQFVTPAIDRDFAAAAVIGIFAAGSASEQRTTALMPLFYQNLSVTPAIGVVVPASSPLIGGTRVTIIGSGFQAPVQVFFGDVVAQVVSVSFLELFVVVPPGRAIGPVDVRVVNVGSGKSVVAKNAFRYADSMRITGVSPNSGPSTGGTRVHITGSGFDVPVAITVAGVPALPIRVSSTEIVAITTPTIARPCNATGAVTVVSIENGEEASGGTFTYVCSSRRRATR